MATSKGDQRAVSGPDAARFFNCCTDYAQPDWETFTHLELGACIDEGPRPGDSPETTYIVGGQPFDEAEFFSVYGRKHDGEAEAITDCPTALDALVVAACLRGLSCLDVHLYP